LVLLFADTTEKAEPAALNEKALAVVTRVKEKLTGKVFSTLLSSKL